MLPSKNNNMDSQNDNRENENNKPTINPSNILSNKPLKRKKRRQNNQLQL